MSSTIDPECITDLNNRDIRDGSYVLYWMQQSQRAMHNHALEYAVQQANTLRKPVIVAFGLMDSYPEANLRHYTFMLEGLQDVQQRLSERDIPLIIQHGHPVDIIQHHSTDAALIVCDCGYLRHQREWRRQIAEHAPCRVVQVESDVIVPVESASSKTEYAARTLRPKLLRLYERFLHLPEQHDPLYQNNIPFFDSLTISDIPSICRSLKLDTSVQPVSTLFRGGTTEAERVFRTFLSSSFDAYAANRSQPQTDHVSYMSMYLHFGHVSPVWLLLKAGELGQSENYDSFKEELLVRRELAMNYVFFNDLYDSYDGLPEWALKTLEEHRGDQRPFVYSQKQFEKAQTHDPYWNATMREMKHTGYMHNYMRMYWGKKILEWSANPADGFKTIIALNNRYFLDGRDPNSYAGAAWVFGRHDRPWPAKPVFGTVRSMTASGLERKCDIQAYVSKIDQRIALLKA